MEIYLPLGNYFPLSMNEGSYSRDPSREPELRTILLGVGGRDDSRVDALVDVVKEVASSNTTVIIVHVFDTDSYKETVKQVANTEDEHIEPDELAAQMSTTEEITGRLEADSIDYEARATTGRKGDGVVEIAEEVDADRVIIGGRQRSPAGKALFGSTAQKVMLNAPCPVTFVRDRE